MKIQKVYDRISAATLLPRVDRALSAVVDWEPIDGFAYNKISPPTYAGGDKNDRKGPENHIEKRPGPDGQLIDIVVIDSVQSQANRFESSILNAYRRGEIKIPNIDLMYGDPINTPISVNSLGHRAYSRPMFMCEIDGVPFQETEWGRKIFSPQAYVSNLALLQLNPMALLFGCWFSTHTNHARVHRSVQSEMIGELLSMGKKSASHFDKVMSSVVGRFAINKASSHVIMLEVGEKIPDGYVEKDPSEVGLGNCTVASLTNGGVSVKWIKQRFICQMVGLQSYSTGRPQEDAKARAMLVTLGLLAHTLSLEEPTAGFLRSGCALMANECVYKFSNTKDPGDFTLTIDEAKELYALAASQTPDYNPSINLELTPTKQFAKVIKNSVSTLVPIQSETTVAPAKPKKAKK